jgi:hypothetical protein
MTAPPPDPSSGTPPFAFSPQDAMEFMQKMWNPFGVAIPGFGLPGAQPGPAPGLPFPNPAAMFVTLDPAELERKISELRVIEGWLQMSLNLMQMSIRTMELQKVSLEALRSTQAPSAPTPPEKPAARHRKG